MLDKVIPAYIVLHIFLAPNGTKCPADKNWTGQGVLMKQKQYDTRLAENKIHCCEQNMKSWSSHHWQLILEQLL